MKIKRCFVPGSEWLYIKIYVSSTLGDQLLCHELYQATKKILQQYAHAFFFVRYVDPDYHLRFRYNITSEDDIGHILGVMNKYLELYIKTHRIQKILIDTYEREIERYGTGTILECESIFYNDSVCCLQLLAEMYKNNFQKYRWQIGLMQIDYLLTTFNLEIDNKYRIMDIMSTSFKKEFLIGKSQENQINLHYRSLKNTIINIMETPPRNYSKILQLQMDKNMISIETINHKLTEAKRNTLLCSLIHMMMNRLFISSHRKNETFLYCILRKYYLEKMARDRYSVN